MNRLAAVSAALVVSGALMFAAHPAAAGDSMRGTVPVSSKVTKQVAADMSEPERLAVEPRCISVQAAASNANWLYVSASGASGCEAIDTVPVIMTRTPGGWSYVYFMAPKPTCKAMNKGTQSTFGPSAPRAVRQDFRGAGLCTRG